MIKFRYGGAAMLLVVLAGCGGTTGTVTPSSAPTLAPTQAPTSTPNPLILAPATTPSAVGICEQQLSFGSSAGPILCSNGAVNILAWQYFVKSYAAIFELGAYATPGQIEQVTSHMSDPMSQAEDAYCLAKAYYGWTYTSNLGPQAYIGVTCASYLSPYP